MPFGRSITSFLADFYPTDPVAPQVTADFVHALPPNPVKGHAVSEFVHDLYPTDPIRPAGLGSHLSEFIKLLREDDGLGDGGTGLGDSGALRQDSSLANNNIVPALSDYFTFG
jgi:hypothetical protein